jgi:hypothetical protein
MRWLGSPFRQSANPFTPLCDELRGHERLNLSYPEALPCWLLSSLRPDSGHERRQNRYDVGLMAPPLGEDPASRRNRQWALATASLLLLVWCIFPGDVRWIGDEPMLFELALRANAAHRLAEVGLLGTKGFHYGPLPTWLYQGWLLVTHDLVPAVLVRALLSGAGILGALWWLSRTLRLWPWFLPMAFCSPWLWDYARGLWDNTFAVPLCALALAAYLDFLARPRRWTWLLVVACLAALPLVHLMSLAFVVPVALHASLTRPRTMARLAPVTLAVVGAFGWAAWPYLHSLLTAPARPRGVPLLEAAGFAFGGARHLGAWGIEAVFGRGWMAWAAGSLAPALRALQAWTLVVHALALVGAGLAVRGALQLARRRELEPLERVRAQAGLLCLCIVGAQALLDGMTGAEGFTHYFNATWIAFAVLAWFGLESTRRVPWLAPATTLSVGAASLTVLLFLLANVHTRGPSREHYGPTLANQTAVARALDRYGPGTQVEVLASSVLRFPDGLRVLRLLDTRRPEEPLPPATLRLEYRSEPWDATLVLRPH